jgi:small nuclear ribonucleoprotein D3
MSRNADGTFTKLSLGVPTKLLHESVGFICTVETKNGALYRGLVLNVEDCFNVQMKDVRFTDKNGKKNNVSNAYIRGSQVMYIVLPDMLRNSPSLQKNVRAVDDGQEDDAQHVAKKQRT